MEGPIALLIEYIGPFILAFIYLLIRNFYKKKQKVIAHNSLEDFKKNSDKIMINLREAKIESLVYGEKIEADTSDMYEKTINHFFFNKPYSDDDHDTYKSNFKNTVTLKNIRYKEFTIDYSEVIVMEKDKLKTWFVFHEETYLYINKSNMEQMYLDLTFME